MTTCSRYHKSGLSQISPLGTSKLLPSWNPGKDIPKLSTNCGGRGLEAHVHYFVAHEPNIHRGIPPFQTCFAPKFSKSNLSSSRKHLHSITPKRTVKHEPLIPFKSYPYWNLPPIQIPRFHRPPSFSPIQRLHRWKHMAVHQGLTKKRAPEHRHGGTSWECHGGFMGIHRFSWQCVGFRWGFHGYYGAYHTESWAIN